MNIEIDQSNKVEQTSKSTVVAFSNDHHRSIMISAREKQQLQKEFRKIGKPRAFVYQTFNVLIFLLIWKEIKAKKISQIVVDKEYIGKEFDLKDHLLAIFLKHHITIDPKIIQFRHIGKKSRAHTIAYQAAKTGRADQRVTDKEVLRILMT